MAFLLLSRLVSLYLALNLLSFCHGFRYYVFFLVLFFVIVRHVFLFDLDLSFVFPFREIKQIL